MISRHSLPEALIIKKKSMFRAISGALSLVLTIVILRLALPQASSLLEQIVVKILLILSKILDQASSLKF